SASSASQSERIMQESSRYNIGNLQRTVNVPVLALLVRYRERQGRCRFNRTEHRDSLLGQPRTHPDDLWVIEYQEVEKQTMIRTTNGRDLSARGRFWLETGTGRGGA